MSDSYFGGLICAMLITVALWSIWREEREILERQITHLIRLERCVCARTSTEAAR